MSVSQLTKAEKFHALHFTGKPLLLPNVWDGMSAAACVMAGFEAIATTSCGVAWSLGYRDGERMPRAAMIAAIKRIARVVGDVPLSADIEAGYAHTNDELAATIKAVMDAGAIGINLEDSFPGAHEQLRNIDEAANRIRVARRAAQDMGLPLVINARVDLYLTAAGDERARDQELFARCRAYLAAGADCVFPIALRDPQKLAALVRELNAPVNAIHPQGQLTGEQLRATGVARVSTASTLALSCFDRLRQTALELRNPLQFAAIKAETSYAQLQAAFAAD